MKLVEISSNIKVAAPKIQLGIIEAQIVYSDYNEKLWEEIEAEIKIISKISTEEIKDIPAIKSTREAYKSFGKEPSRYRPSAEALHRRVVQGKGMYKISTPVDIINLSSLKTGYSIGGYDADKIDGEIIFDKGKAEGEYHAIGRGIMNVENLPVFFDDLGAFGSPTSDSERTMITGEIKNLILLVMNFGGHEFFNDSLVYISDLLGKYCSAKNMNVEIIK